MICKIQSLGKRVWGQTAPQRKKLIFHMCPVSSPDFLWVFLLSHLQHEEQISKEFLGGRCRVLRAAGLSVLFWVLVFLSETLIHTQGQARPNNLFFFVFPLVLNWEYPVYCKPGSEQIKGATHLAHRGCSLAVLLRINKNKMGGWVTPLVLYFLHAFGRAGLGHPGLYTSSVFSELHWCRVLWTLRLFTSSIYLSSVSPVLKSWLPYRNPDFASLQIFSQMPVIRIYLGTSSQQTGNC